jgi:hypothetical protein
MIGNFAKLYSSYHCNWQSAPYHHSRWGKGHVCNPAGLVTNGLLLKLPSHNS